MKQIQELHQKYNKYPEYKDFHLSYSFDRKTKSWQFMGYRCMKCMKIFVRDSTVPGHYNNCKEINKVLKFPKDPEITKDIKVLTVERKIWKPLEINQN